MTSTTPKATPEISSSAAGFSYAQAAKGRTASTTASAPQSNQESGTTTPAKPESSVNGSQYSDKEKITGAQETSTTGDVSNATDNSQTAAEPSQFTETFTSTTAASSSALTQNGESVSMPPHLADTNWRSARPRISNNEPERRKKGKGKKSRVSETELPEAPKEKEEVKPEVFVEASAPAVNIWQQRSQAQAARAKPAPIEQVVPSTVSVAQGESFTKVSDPKKKTKPTTDDSATIASSTKGFKRPTEVVSKKEEVKRTAPRGYRTIEKEDRSSSHTLPPVADAVSWPTPEIAVEEQKKKVQEKHEREDVDEAASQKPKTKKAEWQHMAFIPTVQFQTPLPKFGSTRGGRAARGAREINSRGQTSDAANGNEPPRDTSNSRERTKEAVIPSQESARATATSPSFNGSDQAIVASVHASHKLTSPAQSHKQQPNTSDERAAADQAQSGDLHPDATSPSHFTNGEINKELTASFEQQVPATSARKSNTFERKHDGGMPTNGYAMNGHAREPRDGGRGGRGRGGYRNTQAFPNGQQAYVNGHGQVPNGYAPRQNSMPNAFNPATHQSQQYGSSFLANSQRGRGSGTARAQSISSTSTVYPRYPQGVALHHISNMPAYGFDPQGPISIDIPGLAPITAQVEYYFSIENLFKDVYLRKQMDSQGFVHLDVIARFRKIKELTSDREIFSAACQQAQSLEVVTGEDGIDRVRRRDGWEQFVLPSMTDRDESARNAGPATFYPVQNYQQFLNRNIPVMPALAFQPSMVQPFQPHPVAGSVMPLNGTYEGEHGHQEGSQLSARFNEFIPQLQNFDESRISELSLLYNQPNSREHIHVPANSRTFSNGSISAQELPYVHSEVQSSPTGANGTQTSEK